MRIYIAKRIIFLIPALLFVVLLSYILLHFAPGDPTDEILQNDAVFSSASVTPEYLSKLKTEIHHQLGLDLPLFYFSISSLSEKKISKNEISYKWEKYFPAISLNRENQFQRWLFGDGNYSNGIIRGDLGISWFTKQKISSIILSHMKWTLFFSLVSVIIAYLISIPAGLKSAAKPGSRTDRNLSILFTILFSLPSFWVASLLMLLFCNPGLLNILPSSGVGPTGGFSNESTIWYKFFHTLPYLILPTICYTYSSFAFLSRSLKASVTDIMKEDFITSARAKGLDEKTVVNKHAFRNALLPLITIFSQVFPIALGGSVILETIFTIPGMGLVVYQSISYQDYPVIISVFMVTGIITMFSFVLSDILYAIADPRISYSSKA